jgi:hypothetical protein
MRRLSLALSLLILPVSGVLAKHEPAYAAHTIKANVRQGAHAVVRTEKTEVHILGVDRYRVKVMQAVTILDSKGESFASLTVSYDELEKVLSLKGTLYDANGKELKQLSKRDISDNSYYSSVNFIADNRYKNAQLKHHSFPYTVVWEYETENRNTLFYPAWSPFSAENVGVEFSSFDVLFPSSLQPRILNHLLPDPEHTPAEKGLERYSWSVADLAPFQLEPQAVQKERMPLLQLAPRQFMVEGYEGSMGDWQSLGKFFYTLNEGKADLKKEEEAEFLRQLEGLSSTREKVAATYSYLQQHTRYVSVQLGIGGWQPFPASYVKEKGYGDCKALTNYTKNLLALADIPSYYTLILAEDDEPNYFLDDFPNAGFNHVILCVPNQGDTIWLECTSQTNPFNYLGQSTANRKALLISSEGGKVVRTPRLGAAENLQQTTIQVDLRNASVPIAIERTYQGVLFDQVGGLQQLNQQTQERWLRDYADLPSLNAPSVRLIEKNENQAVGKLAVEGLLLNKPRQNGERLFLPLSLNDLPIRLPRPVPERKTSFEITLGATYDQRITYQLPDKYQAEYLPEELRIETDFGSFTQINRWESGRLVCHYTLTIQAGVYEAKAYADWVSFMQTVKRSLQAKAVLIAQ